MLMRLSPLPKTLRLAWSSITLLQGLLKIQVLELTRGARRARIALEICSNGCLQGDLTKLIFLENLKIYNNGFFFIIFFLILIIIICLWFVGTV
ncbi:hypothetical protein REPUB_Repub08aG0002200 [Reevesia pubescens]